MRTGSSPRGRGPGCRVALALLATSALLAGCGEAEEVAVDPTEPPPSATDEPTTQPSADPSEDASGTTLVGTFGGDPDLEGGCAWVEAADGSRYEVEYPAGYEVRFDPLELVGPDGEVMAGEGDQVRLTGAVDPDLMSFCQIGEIFVATSVEGG